MMGAAAQLAPSFSVSPELQHGRNWPSHVCLPAAVDRDSSPAVS